METAWRWQNLGPCSYYTWQNKTAAVKRLCGETFVCNKTWRKATATLLMDVHVQSCGLRQGQWTTTREENTNTSHCLSRNPGWCELYTSTVQHTLATKHYTIQHWLLVDKSYLVFCSNWSDKNDKTDVNKLRKKSTENWGRGVWDVINGAELRRMQEHFYKSISGCDWSTNWHKDFRLSFKSNGQTI